MATQPLLLHLCNIMAANPFKSLISSDQLSQLQNPASPLCFVLALRPTHPRQDYSLEWDRTLSSVLGVANNRLYTLRLQTASGDYERDKATLASIMESFRCKEVDL